MAGNFVVSSGQSNSYAFLNATVLVKAGGTIAGGTSRNCVITVEKGGAVGSEIMSGGVLTLQSGAGVSGATLAASIAVTAESDITINTVKINPGVTISCGANVRFQGTTSNGGAITGGTVYGQGSVELVTGSVQNQTVAAGATIAVTNGQIKGTVSLLAGAAAVLTGNVGGTINLAGNSYATMTLSADSLPTTLIAGFNGTSDSLSDKIRINGITKSQIASISKVANALYLTLKDGRVLTLNIQNVGTTGYSIIDSGTGIILAVCYLAGVQIETPYGPMAVEQIRVGDRITAIVDGTPQLREVIWTGSGHCRIDRTLPDDLAGYPVCIRKDALGAGMPTRDLYVTAEHGLLLDGHFIPARMLVNGHSIFYDKSRDEYAFYHFETKEHSVVVADGVLSESYLDTGNRAMFSVQSSRIDPAIGMLSWDRDAAAPLMTDRERVEPIYRRIEKMQPAVTKPEQALTDQTDLHLLTDDGRIIRPLRIAGAKHVFQIPPSAQNVTIRSRTSRPCDINGPFHDDRRNLGVLVGQILQFVSGEIVDYDRHLSDCEMSGWHDYAGGASRWTSGDAFLFVADSLGEEHRLVSLEILAGGPYLCADEGAAGDLSASAG
ncbi:Hint domain-containing protein [Asaia bogorensis]|uniref:Hint domain-containing protein n=1 Tax=Asaia bogorensis TaxID=91915 RepID=UPI002864260D|nr:Hint domain-containing protein [Asaia bogorensis]MDR6183624.1 antigen 43 [Asaia bogorensis NBRC 16594]